MTHGTATLLSSVGPVASVVVSWRAIDLGTAVVAVSLAGGFDRGRINDGKRHGGSMGCHLGGGGGRQ